jgi:exopolyphosphatase/pppGpp-phosphohydrolase
MNDSASRPVAALDLGSNSLRLLIARPASDGTFEVLERRRRPLRLASDAFGPGRFSPATLEAMADAMAFFAGRLEHHRVEAYRAVGTEALRRSANSTEAAERVYRRTGLVWEVLTPDQEARLVVAALGTGRESEAPGQLVIDLGGGSLDLIMTAPAVEKELRTESHPLGLAAHFEAFLAERPPGRETRLALWREGHRIGKELSSTLLEQVPRGTPAVLAGGQGGMLDRLAERWGLWTPALSGTAQGISIPAFGALQQRLLEQEPVTLTGQGDVPIDRANMLAGAAALYGALALRIEASCIRLARAGLIEGVLGTVGRHGRSPGRV